MAKNYVTHCTPTEISATSRCAIKVNDNYYTIEVSEKRTVADTNEIDMEAEYAMLFDEVNEVVDNQCNEILQTFKK